MIHGFPELAVGGVLVAPFVPQALLAFGLFMLARPLLRLASVQRCFAGPPLVGVCPYVAMLAVVVLVY